MLFSSTATPLMAASKAFSPFDSALPAAAVALAKAHVQIETGKLVLWFSVVSIDCIEFCLSAALPKQLLKEAVEIIPSPLKEVFFIKSLLFIICFASTFKQVGNTKS